MTQEPGGTTPIGRGTAAERRSHADQADPVRQLLRLADGRLPDVSLLRDALRCAGTEFGAVFGLIKASHRGAMLDDYFHAGPLDPNFWKEPASRALARSIAIGQTVDVRFRSKNAAVRLAVIAAPIGDGAGESFGGLALVIEVQDDHQIDRARVELRAFCATLALLMRPRPVVTPEGASAAELRTVAIAASATSRAGVAIALTNQLRAKLGCEQVAIGAVRRSRISLLSISGFADVSGRTPGSQAILGAMEECLDLGRPVTVSVARGEGEACPLHRRWSAEAEGACVATIPLREQGRPNAAPVAILALRHTPGKQFAAEDLKKIGESVATYPSALRVAEMANRSLITHAQESIAKHALGIGHRRGVLRFATTALLAVGMIWFLFGTMAHTVSTNARIAPAVVRHMTAPFDARIISATVMEGDRVKAGDVLFTLDTANLAVERARLQAAVQAALVDAEGARAKGDHALARLVEARAGVDRVSLQATERRIAESIVRAPSDGIVLRGDLRDRIGATVASGDSLLEFVPTGAMRVLLDISERDILHVAAGARAEFRPHARPDLQLHLTVERIRPAAEVHGAENVFVAEARLDAFEPWMLSGVEGAARVDAGEGKVWWTLFHRLIDAVRLKLWV
jgi:hypothetical protein